ncbi:hypothetical protein D3C71_1243240 [compost metagenome]
MLQGLGNIKVGQAAATVPDLGFRVDFTFPDLFTAVGIDGNHVVMRRTQEDTVADLQRRLLIFSAVAIRTQRSIAGVEGPGDLQVFHVVASDLVQRHEAAATRGIAVVIPIFLLFAFVHRDQRQRLTAESHGRVWLEHLHKGADHANGQYRT